MGNNVVGIPCPFWDGQGKPFRCFDNPSSFCTMIFCRMTPPLWHNKLFTNQLWLIYFRRAFVRKNVLAIGDLLEDDALFNIIAPTWKNCYYVGIHLPVWDPAPLPRRVSGPLGPTRTLNFSSPGRIAWHSARISWPSVFSIDFLAL